jgi:hypothetical protein
MSEESKQKTPATGGGGTIDINIKPGTEQSESGDRVSPLHTHEVILDNAISVRRIGIVTNPKTGQVTVSLTDKH